LSISLVPQLKGNNLAGEDSGTSDLWKKSELC